MVPVNVRADDQTTGRSLLARIVFFVFIVVCSDVGRWRGAQARAQAQSTDPAAPACRWRRANTTMTTEEIGFQEAPLSSTAKTATRLLSVAGGRRRGDLESVSMCKQ